jgi:antitoxin component YwqK of YwqJK toxin-antitoxin module
MRIGYKKGQDDRIITLEILEEAEYDRDEIVFPEYAHYRFVRAKVLKIHDMFDETIEYEEAKGAFNKEFTYEIGQILDASHKLIWTMDPDRDRYDAKENSISYFISMHRAYMYAYRFHNDGVHEFWHDNGQLKARHMYEGGVRHGLSEQWYANKVGQIKCRCTNERGKLDGLLESWYENGQQKLICTYKNGKKDGHSESWHENGHIDFICTYKDGKYHGPSERYHDNGNMWVRCTSIDGEIDGVYESWYANGQEQSVSFHVNGNKSGVYKHWTKSGHEFESELYENGMLVKKEVEPERNEI